MSTQAFQLTIGTQSTVVARGGVGGGLGYTFASSEEQDGADQTAGQASSEERAPSKYSVGIRFFDGDVRLTHENQWQKGVLIRIPRDKRTEQRNAEEFAAVLHEIVHPNALASGPLEAVLAGHPYASINLLGDYSRKSYRGDVSAGIYPLQASLDKLQTRVGAFVQRKGQKVDIRFDEVTGFYQFNERRANETASTVVGKSIPASLRMFTKGKGSMNYGGTGYSHLAEQGIRGIETALRITTLDDVIMPQKTRLITDCSSLDDYRKEFEKQLPQWVNHGIGYSKYPDDPDWTAELKQAATERDYEQCFAEMGRKDSEFTQYLVLRALQGHTGPRMDALQAYIRLAERQGDEPALEHYDKLQNEVLADKSSWELSRLFIIEKAIITQQPAPATPIWLAQVSSVTEAQHNWMQVPRA